MIDVQNIKQQFDIIGSSPALDRGIDIAYQVAPTDLSVLITGESGTGKEVFPKIIHKFSARKHGQYIAVNCGAIPEGTIDSELFGHEKALLQALWICERVISKLSMAGQFFWTK
jgi:transcriptional regulator with PAS, ATPase and Fis domain